MDIDWLSRTPIAHRGLHDARAEIHENTLGAARAAMKHGYSIEMDLQISADHEPIVFHDLTLDRLTEKTGAVRALNVEQLEEIAIARSQDTIPRLRQLLRTVNGKVGIVLELKGLAGADEGFARGVCDLLERYQGPVAVMSFNHWLVKELRERANDIPVGLTAEGDEHLYAIHREFCDQVRPDFVSYNVEDLPNRFVREFLETGKPVIAWTIRSNKQAEFCAQQNIQITFEDFLPSNF